MAGHVANNSTVSAARGAGWIGLATVGEYGLAFVNIVVLARLVSPAEFGIVSLAISFLTIAGLFSQLAMGQALVRCENVSQAHISVAFFTVTGLALTCAGVVVLAAPLLATFYSTPQLREMCWAIAFLIPVQSATSISNALLSRKGAFRALAVSKMPGFVLGYMCTSIALAYAGFGAWSILWGAIVQHSLTAVIAYGAASYLPIWVWSRQAFRDLFSFSVGQSLAQIVNHVALVGDNLVVGRVLGTEALGFYGRAYRLMELPVNVVSSTAYSVAFPLLSSIQSSDERLVRAYESSICALLTFLIPLSVFFVFAARPIVLLLLGEEWTDVVGPFQVLAVSLTFRAAYRHVNLPTLLKGGSYTVAVLSLFYAVWVVGGAIVAVSVFRNTESVAAAVSIAIFLHYAASAWFANRALALRGLDFVLLHAPGVAIGLAVGLALMIAGRLPWVGDHTLVDLTSFGFAAVAAAGVCAFCWPRLFLGQRNLLLLDRVALSIPICGTWLKTWSANACSRA